jgi:hypothetical protein
VQSLIDFCGKCLGNNIDCFFSSVNTAAQAGAISGGVVAGVTIAAIIAALLVKGKKKTQKKRFFLKYIFCLCFRLLMLVSVDTTTTKPREISALQVPTTTRSLTRMSMLVQCQPTGCNRNP